MIQGCAHSSYLWLRWCLLQSPILFLHLLQFIHSTLLLPSWSHSIKFRILHFFLSELSAVLFCLSGWWIKGALYFTPPRDPSMPSNLVHLLHHDATSVFARWGWKRNIPVVRSKWYTSLTAPTTHWKYCIALPQCTWLGWWYCYTCLSVIWRPGPAEPVPPLQLTQAAHMKEHMHCREQNVAVNNRNRWMPGVASGRSTHMKEHAL